MIYTEQTKKALRLCYEAHAGQLDKSGLPYVFHPFHLAEQMPDEDSTVAALLHDVAEDTAYTLEDLRAMGFPPRALEALALLTHDPAEPYLDYVARVKDNPTARRVKLADLRHNSDLSRLEQVTEKDLERVAKYARALRILEAEEASEQRNSCGGRGLPPGSTDRKPAAAPAGGEENP